MHFFFTGVQLLSNLDLLFFFISQKQFPVLAKYHQMDLLDIKEKGNVCLSNKVLTFLEQIEQILLYEIVFVICKLKPLSFCSKL